ncbi:MAG: hypothetical protein ABIE07_12565 [Candidatus Zixiibacteriota bacterium]
MIFTDFETLLSYSLNENWIVLLFFCYVGFKVLWRIYKFYRVISKMFGADYKLTIAETVTFFRRNAYQMGMECRLEDIKLSSNDKNNDFKLVKITCGDSMDIIALSRLLNFKLWDAKDYKISIKKSRTKILRNIFREKSYHYIEILKYYIHDALINKKLFHNEKKLCISGDIFHSTESVICHRGSYFDSYLTNELYTKAIYREIGSKKDMFL